MLMNRYIQFLFIVLLFWRSIGMTQQPLYKNPSVPIDERVNDLVSRMSLEDKISQMQYNAPAIERLDIPEYNWWNECLHGVARAGIATVFPQAIGLAATWNTDLMNEVATVISTEARAKHHEFARQGQRQIYQGLTFWSPNINIFRDPRWGRGQETYGEDPYLTAWMGVSFVKGLQGDDPKYFKVVATPKHFAVHSGPESDRHHFDAVTNEQDLWETYLPAFEACIRDAKAYSIMGAYNRYMGESCCASQKLLVEILREQWGFDGYVVSDCGAIQDIYARHKIVKTPEEAAALAAKMGCDLNCGKIYPHLVQAVAKGLISEEEIDVSVKRLFKARFLLGMFDPAEIVDYANISFEQNDCEAHRQLSLRTAQESIVLLKNENSLLPLKKNLKSIAVIGPNADEVDVLLGNYNGVPSKPVTVLAGIKDKLAPMTNINYAKGCDLVYPKDVPLNPIPVSILKPPPGYGQQHGLRGEYFDNMNLEGKPVLIKFDENVDFDWKSNPPDSTMKREQFSIRWQGRLVAPETGEYELGVRSDDGFRLYVDNKLLLEDWRDHAPRTRRKSIKMVANQEYAIRLEYYENTGGAMVMLGWLKPGEKEEFFKAIEVEFQKAVEIASKAEVVIMVGGISPKLEGEEMPVEIKGFKGGDRTDIQLPEIQQKLLKALRATGTPVVLVLMSGSALAVNWANENIPAMVHAWYPGQEGGTAIADVLFGDYNPAGRLPVTFYKSVDDLPPFEDYNMANRTYRYFKGEPLYPFGYGLSFTTFAYENLRLSSEKINAKENVTVQVDVINAGKIAGDEVVQLYVTDNESSVPAPIKTLKAFKRIHLKPGEKKTISFELSPEAFSLFHNNQGWKIEPGEFEIMVGGSSHKGIKTSLVVTE